MFVKLFPQSSRDIKFIPATGCSEIERINRAVLAILESNLGWCRFFLVRDRDYMTSAMRTNVQARAGKAVIILERHELENYLLDFDLISKTLAELFDLRRNPVQVEEELLTIAKSMAGDVLRDMLAFRLNMLFRPEDFSVPRLFKGEIDYDVASGWSQRISDLQTALESKADGVVNELRSRVGNHNFTALFNECRTELEVALKGKTWMYLFPGKELLDNYCKHLQLSKPPVLHNAIIKEMSTDRQRIPEELNQLITMALAD
jgi:hypothetical protein